MDFNKNGKINYTEFLSATLNVQEFLKPAINKKKLEAIFNQFDTDQTGFID